MALTKLDDRNFDAAEAEALLKKHLGVRELKGFGLEGRRAAISAAGACLAYAKDTQRAAAGHIAEIKYFESSDFMVLDPITLKNLEIFETRGQLTNDIFLPS